MGTLFQAAQQKQYKKSVRSKKIRISAKKVHATVASNILMSMSTQWIKKFDTEFYRLIKVHDSNWKNNFEFGEMFCWNFQSSPEVCSPYERCVWTTSGKRFWLSLTQKKRIDWLVRNSIQQMAIIHSLVEWRVGAGNLFFSNKFNSINIHFIANIVSLLKRLIFYFLSWKN